MSIQSNPVQRAIIAARDKYGIEQSFDDSAIPENLLELFTSAVADNLQAAVFTCLGIRLT